MREKKERELKENNAKEKTNVDKNKERDKDKEEIEELLKNFNLKDKIKKINKRKLFLGFLIFILILNPIKLKNGIFEKIEMNKANEIGYVEFIKNLEDKKYDEIEVNSSKNNNGGETQNIYTKKDGKYKDKFTTDLKDINLAETALKNGVEIKTKEYPLEVYSKGFTVILTLVLQIFYYVLLYGTIIYLISETMKKLTSGERDNINIKKRGDFYEEEKEEVNNEEHNITFKDIGGLGETKNELEQIKDMFLKKDYYKEKGIEIPRGVLLVGPPGTGKTMMAKALANETDTTFLSINASEIGDKYVGTGTEDIKKLFKLARKHKPSIVFIDELDAIGHKRGQGTSDITRERDSTLNTLLTELDGFNSLNEDVFVLAATNNPSSLDEALIRPGRFDKELTISYPSLEDRKEILEIFLEGRKLDENLSIEYISHTLTGTTGADIKAIVNEALLIATKDGRDTLKEEDFVNALSNIFAGLDKKTVLDDNSKKRIAFHEIGHAFLNHKLKGEGSVRKISIIPTTKGALGYALIADEKDTSYLKTKEEIYNEIRVSLAGRASEEVFIGNVSTGASNDLEVATNTLRRAYTHYGMSSLGPVSFAQDNHMFLDRGSSTNFTPDIMRKIDLEIIEDLQKLYQETKDILEENKNTIIDLSNYLYDKETIYKEEFIDIVNKYL